ncbi:MAG: YncE family protein [Janthinobacterium lividum]
MRRFLFALPLLLPLPAQAQTWFAESAQAIPSADSGWNTVTLEPARHRLFVARHSDGLLVWDTRTRQAVTVENSKGASGTVLVPEFNRAYVAMLDGTVLVLDLATLKPIARTDLEAGDLTDGFYEPTQKRVHLITGSRPEKTTWVTLDAATGQVVSRTEFNSRKMDRPVAGEAISGPGGSSGASPGGGPGTSPGGGSAGGPGGTEGAIYATMRDRNLLLQLDPKDLSQQKTWKLGDCTQPVASAWDAAAKRVLIACRGDKPVFVALDPAAGVVATVPIGRGVDGLVSDEARHLIVTANGLDGTMSVIRQAGPNEYALVETIATRPMARTVAIDPESHRLFSVTASFTQPAPGADGKTPPAFYHPDSFTILTYRPN